jgi:hypothetical protein
LSAECGFGTRGRVVFLTECRFDRGGGTFCRSKCGPGRREGAVRRTMVGVTRTGDGLLFVAAGWTGAQGRWGTALAGKRSPVSSPADGIAPFPPYLSPLPPVGGEGEENRQSFAIALSSAA